MRTFALAAAAAVIWAGVAQASSVNVTFVVPQGATPANSMVLTNQTGAGVTNYPLRIGRPFLVGAISHFPQAVLNGTPAVTQADVTNRYSDGSVKFAVLSVLVPSIPVGSPVTVTFQDQVSDPNTAMTTAQMAAMLPNDATMQIDAPAELAGTPPTPKTIAQWAAITDGSFCVTIDGTQQCPVMNFTGIANAQAVAAKIQAAIVALGSPVTAWTDYYHWTLQTNALGTGHTISTAAAPSIGTDISAALGWVTPKFQQPSGTATIGLKAMLNGGFCRVRLGGPIAQTISCADDTTAASFDVGFDGTHHPFRPRFYATFWPGIGKVDVRFVGDGSKSTEIMDKIYLATLNLDGTPVYTLDLTGTQAQAAAVKKHWANTSWVKRLWQGGAPPLQIDIDPNLVYMTSTRFVPNFDPAIPMQRNQIAAYYNALIAGGLEPYDGGYYTKQMSATGGRAEIGPYPVSDGDWLYTGMWQMRDISERMANMAASWPVNVRETQTGRRLSRNDAAGTNTGLGREISITDRPYLSITPYLLMGRPSYGSDLTTIGPVDTNPPWAFDDAHMPAPHYVPYLLTGDPWYLDQMYNWAGFVAFVGDGQSGYYYAGRGPTGQQGVINSQTRGLGWDMRSRAEMAFIAPDADPEKAYFTYLVNDALARWEGTVNITGTPYQTAPVIVGSAGHACTVNCNLWTWGNIVGNHEAAPMPAAAGISPLHMWDNMCNPVTTTPTSPCDASGYVGADSNLFASDVGSDMSPWMQNYYLYGVLRARELGFDAAPLASWLMAFNTGVVFDAGPSPTNSLIPSGEMAALYRMPSALHSTGTWIQTWPDVFAHLWSAYRDGTPQGTAYIGGLPAYYANQTGWNPATGVIGVPPGPQSGASDYYAPTFVGVTCLGADLDPRGADACAWFHAGHAPTPYANGPGGNDPRWSFITRTDTNVLPAIPPQ